MVDDFSTAELAHIEAQTQEVGRYVFEHLSRSRPNLLSRRWWDDKVMAWAMADESVKVQMFRFVDVLPMLGTSESVVRHLQEYFHEVDDHLPTAVRLGLTAASATSVTGRAVAMAARRNAASNARRFIAGTTTAELLTAAKRERKQGRACTFDLLGEAVTSESEADRYLQSYLELLAGIAPAINAWPEVPLCDRTTTGPLPRVNVSVKLSALDSQFDALDFDGTTERVARRLRELLRAAKRYGAFVHVDMESYRAKDLTLHIFRTVLMEDEFRARDDVGIVIQAYLRDALDDLIGLRDWAVERGTSVWIRLVKGAYWDYETVFAGLQGWPVPVFQRKWESDANFERCARFLLRNHPTLRTALGSHNVRSLAHGIAAARQLGIPSTDIELQMLYGMGDLEKEVFTELGYRLRVYMPFGQLIPGMAYLVRRLLENTSNDSFLKSAFTDHASTEVLLMNPLDHNGRHAHHDGQANGRAPTVPDAAPAIVDDFRNEPLLDFAIASERERFRDALGVVRRQLGAHYPLVIDGKPVETHDLIPSFNPSHMHETVGLATAAGKREAQLAVAAAKRAFPAWNALGVERRAELLKAAAARMRERRYELAAWEVFECGKPWREADGDIAEAIDFCEYYARVALHIEGDAHRVDLAGEENEFVYVPRGVAVVIAPWNFPLAILCGMTTAALVTGNTVVMKPAEQSPVIAAKFMEILTEAGFPPGVVNYLPGLGETAGAALVEHPDTALIAFTGSRAVGLAIHRRAAEISTSGGNSVKRVIAEMGGKNAIIVDDDADLDEAVAGVLKSAFGYQGQKCSACSRAIVLEAAYAPFLERLVEAARSLKVGPAEDPSSSIGPVIDEESRQRIEKYLALGAAEGRTALAVEVGPWASEGYYVGPHIFADVPATARIAQEEIFGPVLAVLRAANLDEALRIANGTDYALTGGMYSRSPANLRRARREFLVGNLYLNRPITGAMVGRQPFGGFKMSGIGSQAGGGDYLLQFMLPRTITENTLRRGFAPVKSPASTTGAASEALGE
ncbi:MAG: L-glutamate gamma-semialdehyde dehydrogenase [Planctomycetia bacterium]|nr:L-glutamate gamma-semialdehyde dehydrogenase [Planctomycetia bacterium]